MKATLAMLACLSMVGFLSAAEVTGNNTAVVIQKTAVKANDWQFICVPVNKLDITGAVDADAKVNVADLFPASLYSTGTKVYRVIGADSKLACTLTESGWTAASDGNGTLEFSPGEILWIEGDKTSSSTVFCGQDRTRTTLTKGSANSLKPMQNDSSVAISLYEVVEEPAIGDEILVLANGEDDYVHYMFDKPFGSKEDAYWMTNNGTKLTEEDKIIAAGEAFFYYSNQ